MKFNKAEFRKALKNKYVKAFLHVVRIGEGTVGEVGYRTHFGGSTFESFDDHPRKVISAGGYKSSAAGAYQFLSRTWDWINGLYKWNDFAPESQDEAAVALIAHRGALHDIVSGDFETAVKKCAKEWASLPGSPYGQPTISWDKAKKEYEKRLRQFADEDSPEIDPTEAQEAEKDLQPPPTIDKVELGDSYYQYESELPKAERWELAETYREGKPVIGKFTFPEIMSLLFILGSYGLGCSVIFLTEISGEFKAAIITALVMNSIGDVRGFWFGNTVAREHDEERRNQK